MVHLQGDMMGRAVYPRVRNEVFLRADIRNILRGLMYSVASVDDGEWKRGYVHALEAVAIAFDVVPGEDLGRQKEAYE